jgi:hypothetical protein
VRAATLFAGKQQLDEATAALSKAAANLGPDRSQLHAEQCAAIL